MGFFFGAFFTAVGRFLLQLMLIIGLPRVLNYGLVHIGQPLVLSELITGIIYGPSLMGRIPNWTEWIWPSSSLGMLNGLAQLGLILFMFVVGISLDLTQMKKNWKAVLCAAILGNATPFLAAVPIAFLLDDPKYTTANFGLLILLLAIGFGVSALAFLARVLGERNLLGTELAVVTLCTTAIDTGVAWIELAIVISVNTTTTSGGSILDSLAPVWIILVSIAHFLLVITVGRYILKLIGRHVHKKGQIEAIYFWMTIFMVFGVAWLSEETGISGMLGAFEFGLCVPKNGTFNVGLKAKIEEVLVLIMIPVYFTLSGLRTDFGQLDVWYYWLIMVLFVVAATIAKLPGTMIPAKIFGLGWWDSLAFGVLMSCKGLVALVMFNLLLDAKVITPILFAMFVGYIIITTFLVTPLMRMIGALKEWGVARIKRKREKFIMYMLPRTPSMAPPIMTIATWMNSSFFNKRDLPPEYRIARIMDPNKEYIGLMTRKTYKQDVIFAPATQRANFLKVRLDYEYITTIDPVSGLLTRLHSSEAKPDLFIMGNDLTHLGQELVGDVLYSHAMHTLIFTGRDFSNVMRKVLLAYKGNNPDNDLALQVAYQVVTSSANAVNEVVVLLLDGAPPENEIEFLQDDEYFGSKVKLTLLHAKPKKGGDISAIKSALKKKKKNKDKKKKKKKKKKYSHPDVDFLVTPRLDIGMSDAEVRHVLNTMNDLHCPSLYVSFKHNASDTETATETTETTEATELTDMPMEDGKGTATASDDESYSTDVEKGEK